RKTTPASSPACAGSAAVAMMAEASNTVRMERRGIMVAPNENKMSDGGRGRVSVGVEVWKSSQMLGAQRSAVRSIAWLGLLHMTGREDDKRFVSSLIFWSRTVNQSDLDRPRIRWWPRCNCTEAKLLSDAIYIWVAGREQQAADMSVRRHDSDDIAVSVTERMGLADLRGVQHRFGAPVRELGCVL